MQSKVGEYPFTVEPFHCDFSNHLFLSCLSNDLLNASDYHSESRGYGISYLNSKHRTWVLSRLAVEMNDMPVAYDKIAISTWVEAAFRFFTSRNYAITSQNHQTVYGYGRSIWAMIDTDTRQPVDILQIQNGIIKDYIETELDCPIAKPGRVAISKEAELVRTVTMNYHDIDVNGHVNSIKYIEHILDLFDLDWYLSHRVKRFDIAYVAESHAGDALCFFMEKVAPKGTDFDEEYLVRIVKRGSENSEVVRCSINFVKN